MPVRTLWYRKVKNSIGNYKGMLIETNNDKTNYARCRLRVLNGVISYIEEHKHLVNLKNFHAPLHYLLALYEKYETNRWP